MVSLIKPASSEKKKTHLHPMDHVRAGPQLTSSLLGIEPRASHWSGTHSATKSHPLDIFTFYSILFLFVTLEIEPKASQSPGKCSTTVHVTSLASPFIHV